MREIKFRGKTVEGAKLWKYGSFLAPSNAACKPLIYEHFSKPTHDGNGYWYEVDESTVGQYTGLLDADGREIYEDDIVRVVHYGEESIHVIKYCDDMDYPAFDLLPHFDCDSNGLSFCKCEREATITVIGNAHDNPELLERML